MKLIASLLCAFLLGGVVARADSDTKVTREHEMKDESPSGNVEDKGKVEHHTKADKTGSQTDIDRQSEHKALGKKHKHHTHEKVTRDSKGNVIKDEKSGK